MGTREASAFDLPERPGALTRARVALRALLTLAEDQGHELAGPALMMSVDGGVLRAIAQRYARDDEGRALLRERPSLEIDPSRVGVLRAMPAGTLGHALGGYYAANGIAPFSCVRPVRTDAEYLATRYRKLHDMLHLVTGYGTDVIGECELQAFIFGGLGLRHCLMPIVYAALVRPLGTPPVWTYMHRLRSAYRRGQRAGDLAIKPCYEQYLTLPIDEVRARLGLHMPAGS